MRSSVDDSEAIHQEYLQRLPKRKPNQETRQVIETLTDFQQHACGVPHEFDLALLGGRGGGKSTIALAVAYQVAVAYPGVRSIYCRQSYGSLHDALINSVQLYTALDPGSRLNKSDLHWTFSNLSSLTFAPLSDIDLYRRWQGANVSGVAIFDEASQWSSPELPDLLLSNLRSSTNRTRAIYIANPGDRGHWWIYERFIKPCPGDGQPFITDNGRETVVLRSTYRDNPHLGDDYIDNLAAATKHDPVLLKMWTDGDWSLQGGAYFSEVLSQNNIIEWWPSEGFYSHSDWRFFLAMDWGSSAPAVFLLCARAKDSCIGPDDERYIKGDIVIVAEVATNLPGELNKGDKSTVGEASTKVKEMCSTWWNSPRRGCGDDAIFSEVGHERGSLGKEFEANGLLIEPAGKGKRIPGWTVVKQRLSNARPNGEREKPAIYINAHRCPYLWETLRLLVPDARHREDVETDGPDHAADALRYGVVWDQPSPVTMTGLYR